MASRFRTAREVSCLSVAAVGFAAVGAAGALPLPVAVAAVIAAGAGLRDPRSLRVPPWAWNAAAMAFLAWCGARLWAGEPALALGGDLLSFVQVHRLESRRGPRDGLYVLVIAFGQLLLASILTLDPLFLVASVAFLVAAAWLLLLVRLETEARAHLPPPGERGRGKGSGTGEREPDLAELDGLLTPRFALGVWATTLAMLAVTVALFFLLPRFQVGAAAAVGPPVHVAGFSDEVRLGEVGLAQRRRDPVMRVRAARLGPGAEARIDALYLFGLALDRFDGRSWSLSDEVRMPHRGRRPTWPPPRKPPPDADLVLEVTRERLDTGAIFTAGDPVAVFGPFGGLETTVTGGLFLPAPPPRLTYVVYARTTPAGDPAPLSAEERGRYLAIPPVSARVRALARELAARGATPGEKARAMEDHLARGDLTYTLIQPDPGGEDPLDAFLFTARAGHCEYFASAMAVLLRAEGIPSRIVNGFLADEYVAPGGYLLVRQSDAHSWVEAHLPGRGWTRFDPTPAAGDGAGGHALTSLGHYLDLLRERWDRLVLDYDLGAQFGAWSRVSEGLEGLSRWGAGGGGRGRVPEAAFAPDPGRRRREVAGAVAGLAALLGLVVLGRRARERAATPGPHQLATPAARALGRAVLRAADRASALPDLAPPGATVRELFAAVEARWPQDLTGLVALADRYYAVRFGGALPDLQEVRRARALCRSVVRVTGRRGSRRGPSLAPGPPADGLPGSGQVG
ncbi:DUF3488 and transglutaminase-like domain-containing protein [Myxococcota bacterium]|nr:DUF3488 and transglutaminase-like domain-containing protein [Myxococcota bacterium]